MTLLVEQNGSIYELSAGGVLSHVSGPERGTDLPNLPGGYFPDIRADVAAEPWRVAPWTVKRYTPEPDDDDDDDDDEDLTLEQLIARGPKIY